jgi:hypothetical protein
MHAGKSSPPPFTDRLQALKNLGIALIPATAPDFFLEDTPTAVPEGKHGGALARSAAGQALPDVSDHFEGGRTPNHEDATLSLQLHQPTDLDRQAPDG